VRLFTGFAPDELGANASLGLAGSFVMTNEEWEVFASTVIGNDQAVIQVVPEDNRVGDLDNR
jgi:hypothetical protein